MKWITQADIEAVLDTGKLAELADDNGDGEADTAVVEAAGKHAETRFENAIAGRYVAPEDSAAPDSVVCLCADLAVAELWRRRNKFTADAIPEALKNAEEVLTEIREGRWKLEGLTAWTASKVYLRDDSGSIVEGY